jgi:hypothetical protein
MQGRDKILVGKPEANRPFNNNNNNIFNCKWAVARWQRL